MCIGEVRTSGRVLARPLLLYQSTQKKKLVHNRYLQIKATMVIVIGLEASYINFMSMPNMLVVYFSAPVSSIGLVCR